MFPSAPSPAGAVSRCFCSSPNKGLIFYTIIMSGFLHFLRPSVASVVCEEKLSGERSRLLILSDRLSLSGLLKESEPVRYVLPRLFEVVNHLQELEVIPSHPSTLTDAPVPRRAVDYLSVTGAGTTTDPSTRGARSVQARAVFN
jgi:hypothetical protein